MTDVKPVSAQRTSRRAYLFSPPCHTAQDCHTVSVSDEPLLTARQKATAAAKSAQSAPASPPPAPEPPKVFNSIGRRLDSPKPPSPSPRTVSYDLPIRSARPR